MSIANFLSSAAKTGSALAGAINPYMQIGSAAAGLFGSIFGGQSSAEKQNEANLKFQREENQKNREFALQQMNRQELFNTAAANTAWDRALNMYQRQRDDNSLYSQAQQARRAGINPFGIFGNGAFNGASAPSVPVASSSSAPSANGVAPQYSFLEPAKYDRFLSKFSAVAEAINSLAGASNNNASAQSTREKLSSELELLMHQASTEEARSQIEANRAALDTYFGFAERETALKSANKSIEDLEKDIILKGKDIEQKDFDLSCNEIRRKILNQEERLGFYKVQTAIFNFNHLAESWQADINLKRAQTSASSASAKQSLASADNLNADTQTKNESRPFVVGSLANSFEQGMVKTVDDCVKLAQFIHLAPDVKKKLEKELRQMDTEEAIRKMKALATFQDLVMPSGQISIPVLGNFGFKIDRPSY